MPKGVPISLSQRIQHLLDERQRCADALAKVDGTLEQIGAVIGHSQNGAKRRGRPPGSGKAAADLSPKAKKKRKGRGSYATTAEDFVLNFLKTTKSPTTRQMNAAWKEEGRGHTADNTLTKLVKEGKVKRTPLEGERGSTFSLT